MASWLYRFYDDLTRKKVYDSNTVQESQLKRCLSIFDLTILGIGSTLGTGTYILTGQVAHETAGPSVVLSFVVAAIASVLAGLCYAEFGARAPRAGSAYTYTYVTVGEVMAFIVGWNMILEYVIGAASTARALSAYFDSLINFSMQKFFTTYFPIHSKLFSNYADIFAMSLCLIITVLLIIGIKESAVMNNILTAINLIVTALVVVIGFTRVNLHNWNLSPAEAVNATGPVGHGGFFPFGIEGTLAGAATCFYAFVGFDLVATTGEETRNPQRAIPLSIGLTLFFCSIIYCLVSIVLTLMVPYFVIDPNAGLPEAFRYVQLPSFKYIIGIGALSGIFTSLLGSLLPLPRVLYAIASDGLIFRFIAWIHPRLQTPLIATLIGGIISALMALLFDLKSLVEMMSIGTLLAYSLVSVSILFLRYQPMENSDGRNVHQTNGPTSYTAKKAYYLVIGLVINSCLLCATQIFAMNQIRRANPVAISFLILFIIIEILLIILFARLPVHKSPLYFQTPFVPYVPIFSVLINIYLILKLSPITWIRFVVWMFTGFLIYGFYGFWHSSQRFSNAAQRLLSNSRENLLTDE